MGANQSTRKITVVNDEVSGVIKISDAVVQRLKGEISGEAASQEPKAAPPPAPAPAPPPPEPKVEAPPPPPPVEVAPPPPPHVEAAPPPPAVEVATPPPPPVETAIQPPPPPVEVAPPPPPPVVVAAPPAAEPAPPPPAAPEAAVPTPAHVWQRPIIQYIEEPSLSALRVRAEKEEELKRLEEYWKDRLQKQEENHIANAKLTEEEILKSAKHVQTLFTPASTREICRDSRLAVQSCYSDNPSSPLLCREKVLEFSSCVSKSRLDLLTPSG